MKAAQVVGGLRDDTKKRIKRRIGGFGRSRFIHPLMMRGVRPRRKQDPLLSTERVIFGGPNGYGVFRGGVSVGMLNISRHAVQKYSARIFSVPWISI
jgi:hypothetical protein